MFSYDKDKWKVWDGDSFLRMKKEDVDLSKFWQKGYCIWPREDLMQFRHKTKDIIIDFGYTGEELPETEPDGVWKVVVLDEDFESTLDFVEYTFNYPLFLLAIQNIECLVEKHT